MGIRSPERLTIIANNKVAQVNLGNFLRGEKPDSSDLQAIVEAGRAQMFRREILRMDPSIPPPGKRRREDFMTAAGHVKWNPPLIEQSKTASPDNSEVVRDKELDELTRKLKIKLNKLKSKLGAKPISLIDYFDAADCFTTRMLVDTLREVLYPNYHDLVEDGLRANFRSDGPIKNDQARYKGRVEEATQKGIVIAGGTFSDADDRHGTWFRENIMTQFLNNKDVRAVMVCWSYQVMARAFSEEKNMGLFVLNGALKFGQLPVDILAEGPFKKMFSKSAGLRRTRKITAASTHSDHLVSIPHRSLDHLGDRIVAPDRKTELRVVAWDPLTNQPCGYMSEDERIIGVSFHPEITLSPHHPRFDEDFAQIQAFIHRKTIEEILLERFGHSSSTIERNFEPREPMHNIGKAFYTSVLDFHADSLLKTL